MRARTLVGTITTPSGNALEVLRDERGRYWTRLSFTDAESLLHVRGFDCETALLHLLPADEVVPA